MAFDKQARVKALEVVARRGSADSGASRRGVEAILHEGISQARLRESESSGGEEAAD